MVTVGYGWGKGLTVKIPKRIWGTKELPWVLIVVVDDDGTFNRSGYLKRVNFTECKPDLKKKKNSLPK